ncbi:MAG: hypothetical protein Q8Q32_01480 [bacterium]|nr:hypothetical protein [bacterium]
MNPREGYKKALWYLIPTFLIYLGFVLYPFLSKCGLNIVYFLIYAPAIALGSVTILLIVWCFWRKMRSLNQNIGYPRFLSRASMIFFVLTVLASVVTILIIVNQNFCV